jgi:phosphoribosylformylglycinamidine synthase
MRKKVRIAITLKSSVLDPQGKAIHTALINYGFNDIHDVRQGKIIDLQLDISSSEHIKQQVDLMCQKLLANTVIENFEILSIE